jgi:hypothetical protein
MINSRDSIAKSIKSKTVHCKALLRSNCFTLGTNSYLSNAAPETGRRERRKRKRRKRMDGNGGCNELINPQEDRSRVD